MSKTDIMKLVLDADGDKLAKVEAALAGRAGQDVEPFLSAADICRTLKVSRSTLWRLNPPSISIRGCRRYRLSDVVGGGK